MMQLTRASQWRSLVTEWEARLHTVADFMRKVKARIVAKTFPTAVHDTRAQGLSEEMMAMLSWEPHPIVVKHSITTTIIVIITLRTNSGSVDYVTGK